MLKRRFTLWAVSLASAIVAGASFLAVKSYQAQREAFFGPRVLPDAQAIERVGLDGVSDVSFEAPTGVLRGWHVPSKNRAAVVFVHGSGTNRSALLAEARILAEAGFGVLLFDLPGHGASAGSIQWGQAERDAIQAAISFALAQPGTERGRVGAFGFSIGGSVLLQVAAHDSRVHAVVIAATPPDFVEQSHWQFKRWGPISQVPAKLALRWAGMTVDEYAASNLITKISPRPLLMIGATRDPTVPEFMVRKLFAHARQPKQLWIVRGAGHGNYFATAPEEYRRLLTEFFRAGLLMTP